MRYLVMLALLTLAGCSSTRPGFILAPQVFAPQSNQLQQTRFAFAVIDERGLPYTLRIQNGDNVEQIATSNNLTGQLQQSLVQALQEQGAVQDAGSDVQLTVKIAQLQALVDQRTLEHSVTNQVALTVQVQHPQGSFSKTYSGDSSFTAPFKMDIAAVERELRVLTEQVITQMWQDSSWQQALRR